MGDFKGAEEGEQSSEEFEDEDEDEDLDVDEDSDGDVDDDEEEEEAEEWTGFSGDPIHEPVGLKAESSTVITPGD